MMLLQVSSKLIRSAAVRQTFQRSLALSASVKLDPVQQVFVDQIKKYQQLSQKQGGAVDAGAEFSQAKQEAIARIAKLYNVTEPDKFPSFQFAEPDLNQDESDVTTN